MAEPQDIEQWMRELRKSEVTERDDSGDYVFRSGTAACHVRGLTGDPAAVRCVAMAAVDVELSYPLLRELNDISVRSHRPGDLGQRNRRRPTVAGDGRTAPADVHPHLCRSDPRRQPARSDDRRAARWPHPVPEHRRPMPDCADDPPGTRPPALNVEGTNRPGTRLHRRTVPGHAPGPTPSAATSSHSPRGALAGAVAPEPPDHRPAARLQLNRLAARQPGPSVTSVTFSPTLHTARLTLDPYQEADEEDFVAFFQDTRVSQYMDDGPQSEAEDRALFHRVFPLHTEQRFAVWAVRRDGRLIGHAEIKGTDTVDGYEIIYALAADQWGEGLGTEVARTLIDYGFNTLDLDQVHATVAEENSGSWKLLERIGFDHVRDNDEHDHVTRVYSLTDQIVTWRRPLADPAV